MALYNTTPEQLAAVAVAMRYHASMNPYAYVRTPITTEDVLNSKMIAVRYIRWNVHRYVTVPGPWY